MKRLVTSLAAAAALCVTSAMATTDIEYGSTEAFDGATVDLFITTDGTLGALKSSDILNWNISITDGSGSVDLTPLNSKLLLTGTALTATSSALDFNFAASAAQLLFASPTASSANPFWCAQSVSQDCFVSDTSFGRIGVSTQAGGTPFEFVQINPAEDPNIPIADFFANVPEPATWGLMLAGFASLGAALRGRRCKLATA